MAANLRVIDWEGAMDQVHGDSEFLSEVLDDLFKESEEAEQEITEAIKAKNLTTVMKAAHRVKGSSSYLRCERLMSTSLHLQELGVLGLGAEEAKQESILVDIEAMFAKYSQALADLRVEVTPENLQKAVERYERNQGKEDGKAGGGGKEDA